MKVDLKEICLSIFQAGLKAVDPREAVKRALHLSGDELQMGQRRYRLSDFKRIWTVGAGKAAVPMAQAIEDILGERLKGGVVITKYGHIAELKKVRIMEAGHPIPDEAGQRGARALVDMVKELGEGDLLL